MANSHLRRPAAGATAKPSVKGLTRSTRWSSLAMLGGEEDAQVYLKKEGEDWISSLPDDVLLNIVERLSIADAVRTSILSRRWRPIPAMLSKICITVGSVAPGYDVARANAAVLRATASLLEERTTSPYPIRQLCLQFFLGYGFFRICWIVADAIAAHKVGLTELDVLTRKETEQFTAGNMVDNGTELNIFLKHYPAILSGLTRLKLQNVRLPESDLAKLFGLCKQLEFLRLDNCDMHFISLLEVEHPQLRELEILRSNFETVDLKWLPELTTLTFSCWLPQHDDPLSFGHVPLLHTVSISNKAGLSHKMLKLSEFLRKATLSNLHVNFQSEKIWVKPEGPRELSQVFNKLRLVNLAGISEECDLTWTMFILHGAPSLEELCIRVCDCLGIWGKKALECSKERKDADAKWETSASDFKHHNLSGLRIIGFQSEDKFVNYVTAVMESAVNLKDIYLHEKPVCEKCMYDHRPKNRYPRIKSQRTLVSNSFGMDTRPLLTLHFSSLREQCYGSAG